MKLSMSGEYGIRAMLYLSTISIGESVHIADISRSQGIPDSLLRKIIGQLVKWDLVHSKRGKGGGISLAQPAEEISLLNVIEAIEGKIQLNECLISPKLCSRISACAVHLVWKQVQDQMKNTLNANSLASLTVKEKKYNKQIQIRRK